MHFIGFGALDGTKPYKFIWFGDIHGPKPYKFIAYLRLVTHFKFGVTPSLPLPPGFLIGGCYVSVWGLEAEDMGVVMSQFWAGRLRIWGLLCRSFWPGG